MKIIIKLLLLLCLCLGLFKPCAAFAQYISQPTVAVQPTTPPIMNYSWEETSKVYRGFGWGLFGGGLVFTGLGIGIAVALPKKEKDSNNSDSSDEGCGSAAGIGAMFIVFGGLAVGAGIGLLIADAIKFNPYRRGEVADGFQWNPDIIVSPQMSGFGISGRF